jgi:hypothetical protein
MAARCYCPSWLRATIVDSFSAARKVNRRESGDGYDYIISP